MNSLEIRQKFLDFFEKKGHKVVPSSSLVSDDPSVLFTTAGMQQFKPYYLGAKDPIKDFQTKNTTSVQKCVRTSDIDEVGDETHLTFFEMLGNFSFGGYFKKEAIELAYEFITKELGLVIDFVSVYEGSAKVPRDTESEKIWRNMDSSLEVRHAGSDNFWGPTGEEGPCGPTTEIYVDGVEIWNIVFNEFYQNKDKTLKPLGIKGVDTGMGLERLLVMTEGVSSVYETDLFSHILIELDSQIQNKEQKENTVSFEKSRKIVADHIRTATFMIADGVLPSNTERGYILRRIIRRAVVNADKINFITQELGYLATQGVINSYINVYPDLSEKRGLVHDVILKEENKFRETLKEGLKQFKKGMDPFILFSTYGFPLELTKELAKEQGIEINAQDFEEKLKKHQEISKAGSEQKFKGGLAGHSEMEIKYHTATHLLHQALHDVLGDKVSQKGSNITPERLRFDFSFERKMTDEEKKKVEEIVNKKISEALPVNQVILPKKEAEESGAYHSFNEKYPDEVSVYFIGESLGSAYSKEFCGGPHVKNTKELGKFKISKEEAVASGVRRIKAILE